MKKIVIGTLNGGGHLTLARLYNSLRENVFPEIENNFEFSWHVLIQGDKGCDLNKIYLIIDKFSKYIHLHKIPENIGVVKGTNRLYDFAKKESFDIFWMIDDDIAICSKDVVHLLSDSVLNKGYKTCCTQVCYFGPKEQKEKYEKMKGNIISLPDHGSGCTMYHKDVFEKCGYYDENITQYASDTEFNNRIKLAFGKNSLSMLCGKNKCAHYNQTGTRNCYDRETFQRIVKQDNEYVRNKKYTEYNIFCSKK